MEQWSEAFLLTGVGVISLAILAGPAASPAEFDLVRHTTSEQAGQGMAGAWIMRAGFVAYGSSVLAAALTGMRSRAWVRGAMAVFGAGLVATAIWSNASILPDYPSDMREDYLHSVASGVVGLAFVMAAAARLFVYDGWRRDGIAWIALAAAVVIPLAMFEIVPEARGILQRAMFAISIVFALDEFIGRHA